MGKIEARLKQSGERSPFKIVEKKVSTAISKIEEKHQAFVETGIRDTLQEVYNSFDRLIGRNVEDPTEKPVTKHLKKELPAINKEYARLLKEFQAVKEEYEE